MHGPDSAAEPLVDAFVAEMPESIPVSLPASIDVHAGASAATPRAFSMAVGLFIGAAVAVGYIQGPVAVPGREWLEEVLVNSTPWLPFRQLEAPAVNATEASADEAEPPRLTGWAAFEMDENGSAVTARKPRSAEVRYELSERSRDCPRGLEIATREECRFAVEVLGMTVSDVPSSNVTNLPPFCSVVADGLNATVLFKPGCDQSCFEDGVDYNPYEDLRTIGPRSACQCQHECQTEPQCGSWTLNKNSGNCYLKKATANKTRQDGTFISGPRQCKHVVRTDARPVCLTVPRPSECPACVSSKRIVPDVVIPFYESDLCKFGLVAKSLSVNDPEHVLGDLHFLWVSQHSPERYMAEIEGHIAQANTTHVVHFYDLSHVVQAGGLPGWNAQQVMKLKIASVIEADYFLVLDSKNILVNALEINTLVTPCNQAKTFAWASSQSMPEPHRSWFASTARLLGVPWPNGDIWPDSVTPMTFHRLTVLEMLRSIGEDADIWHMCKGPLCEWIRSQAATEFALYQLYARFRTDVQCYHENSGLIHSSLWRGSVDGSIVQQKINDHPFFFGAQAGALDGIWGESRAWVGQQLQNLFTGSGLLNSSDRTLTPESLMTCINR